MSFLFLDFRTDQLFEGFTYLRQNGYAGNFDGKFYTHDYSVRDFNEGWKPDRTKVFAQFSQEEDDRPADHCKQAH